MNFLVVDELALGKLGVILATVLMLVLIEKKIHVSGDAGSIRKTDSINGCSSGV